MDDIETEDLRETDERATPAQVAWIVTMMLMAMAIAFLGGYLTMQYPLVAVFLVFALVLGAFALLEH